MDKIHILPNTKHVNKSELEPDHCYLQIISVDVYLKPEELKQKETLFEQNFNISTYMFLYSSGYYQFANVIILPLPLLLLLLLQTTWFISIL